MLAVPAARGVRHPAGRGMAHFRALDRTRPMGVGGGVCGGPSHPACVARNRDGSNPKARKP